MPELGNSFEQRKAPLVIAVWLETSSGKTTSGVFLKQEEFPRDETRYGRRRGERSGSASFLDQRCSRSDAA